MPHVEVRVTGASGLRKDVAPTMLDPEGDVATLPATEAIQVDARALPVIQLRLLPVALNDGVGANTTFPRGH